VTSIELEDRARGPSPALPAAQRPALWRALLRAMRPHHWAKNALVFCPLILSHSFTDATLVLHSVLAFVAFSLAASGIYLLNDLRDVASDRTHPVKRFRPIAAGHLPEAVARAVAPGLLVAAFALTMTGPNRLWFALALAAYVGLSLAYVFVLKRKLLVDVIGLASLHTLRIIAGNAATGIALSSWLLAFSMSVFLSLALVKRYAELRDSQDDSGLRARGRGYRTEDLDMLAQMGLSSALMSVVVLALYADSMAVRALYATPHLIWLLCPLVLYVLTRVWFLARRGEMHDDPLMFIITDWRNQLLGLAAAALLLAATWL
jgi:4-hydroxybenzoate polyprenyltransferase